jgi:hypothetical protein
MSRKFGFCVKRPKPREWGYKMHYKKSARMILLLFALSLLLTATSHSQEENETCFDSGGETLRLFAPSTLADNFTAVLDPLAAECGFTLQIDILGNSGADYNDSLTTSIVAGDFPQLALIPNIDSLINLSTTGYMRNLEEPVFGDGASLLPVPSTASAWHGMGSVYNPGTNTSTYYGLVIDASLSSSLVWYNPSVFDPYNLGLDSDFATFMSFVDEVGDGSPRALSVGSFALTSFFGEILPRSQGIEAMNSLLSPKPAGYWYDPAVLSGLEAFRALTDNAYIEDYQTSIASVFSQDPSALMLIGATYSEAEIRELGFTSFGENYYFFPLPVYENENLVVQVHVNYLAAFDVTNATRAVLNFFASPYGSTAWANINDRISPYGESGTENMPALGAEGDLLQNLSSEQITLDLSLMWDGSSDANVILGNFASGEISSSEDAAGQIQENYDRICRVRECTLLSCEYKYSWCN